MPITWFPISKTKKFCDSKLKCCYRIGLPLTVAKADSIHSLQGCTIGKNKTLEKMLLYWNKKAESLWPNILYVALSRPETKSDIALNFKFSLEDVTKISTSDTWKAQDREINNIITNAMNNREILKENSIGSEDDLIDMIQWVIAKTRQTSLEQRNDNSNYDNDPQSQHIFYCSNNLVDIWEESIRNYLSN